MAEHGIGTVTLNGDVPKVMKLVMLFIDRVGFPTMAFLLMFYMAYCSMDKMTKAMQENSLVLNEFRVTSKDFQAVVVKDHSKFQTDIEEIKKYSYGYNDYKNGKIR